MAWPSGAGTDLMPLRPRSSQIGAGAFLDVLRADWRVLVEAQGAQIPTIQGGSADCPRESALFHRDWQSSLGRFGSAPLVAPSGAAEQQASGSHEACGGHQWRPGRRGREA